MMQRYIISLVNGCFLRFNKAAPATNKEIQDQKENIIFHLDRNCSNRILRWLIILH